MILAVKRSLPDAQARVRWHCPMVGLALVELIFYRGLAKAILTITCHILFYFP